MKLEKKFYVASQRMALGTTGYDTWTKETLEEAVAHATKLAQDTEKDQMVVQIVKIVVVQRIPVVVEDVE